ncbi:His-Xaa-Ser system radical SAM maturase HxsB [Sphingomonas guangdongensis]|uniref:His-Xaa-Ser system radical SAM maturase HxsB n=1 Tax=Sphingomonas guangdongensis TaxID=1141890 RepID=A0A285QFY6_9SPHN|nr:radical SAM protein [Sphingomonas guangdongensis]SOB80746.1 His-Xaa-Ser system radical SAM maturase HxsB [Sphingomonas guangdongensis]
MTPLPLRFHPLRNGRALAVNDAGRFFSTDEAFLDRIIDRRLSPDDRAFLLREGHAYGRERDLAHLAHLRGIARRTCAPTQLDYLILVPTLRCDLACSYCQVSRAAIGSVGYDWTPGTLDAVLRMLDGLESDSVKLEFQGGEPTLRPDLITAVMERARRFPRRQIVICTNLSRLDDETLAILDDPDVLVSTSLDGDPDTHRRNRTGSVHADDVFRRNLDLLLARYGPDKVAALPTVDPLAPPDVDTLIEAYVGRGMNSIPLRPIVYHGFARKRHSASADPGEAWLAYHERFVRRIVERNWADRSRVIEESHLALCIRRIFRPGVDNHVDLRNPNPMGIDYLVVDHDGTLYPTDEARMLARSGVIDLSIGHVSSGVDAARRDLLNAHSDNVHDPACSRCAFQPYCGRDMVDDIARYGRIDVARRDTDFCRRQTHAFDLAFDLIHDDDSAVRHSVARWLGLPGDPPALGIHHA